MEITYRTVDIERRGYGRRYTWLPVDEITREGFLIDCTNTYMRPSMFDILPGDIVRWRDGTKQFQGCVSAIVRDETHLSANLADVALIIPEQN